ncbi:MAG: hypothetical protein R6V35_03520 [Candidatus Nanohaloarchaea archaeon]
MTDIFEPVESCRESIKFRYMVEASNKFRELTRTNREEGKKWQGGEGEDAVRDLFWNSSDYEELRDNVEKKVDFLLLEDLEEEAEYVREFFNESAEAFSEEIDEDPIEFIMSELAYSDGERYVREFGKILHEEDERNMIARAAKKSDNNYELARNLREGLKEYEEDRGLDEEELEDAIVDVFWKIDER